MAKDLSWQEYNQVVLDAANRGAQIAIETHRRMGRSIVIWKDGRIQHIPPEDIEPRDLAALQNVNSGS
jgi:hypothetical protein